MSLSQIDPPSITLADPVVSTPLEEVNMSNTTLTASSAPGGGVVDQIRGFLDEVGGLVVSVNDQIQEIDSAIEESRESSTNETSTVGAPNPTAQVERGDGTQNAKIATSIGLILLLLLLLASGKKGK